MEFKDYKEKQEYVKRLYKERGTFSWVSKEPGNIKGKTLTTGKKKTKKK